MVVGQMVGLMVLLKPFEEGNMVVGSTVGMLRKEGLMVVRGVILVG